jgi:non-ribosomal peptide synthase protein (TIGR01720 family)
LPRAERNALEVPIDLVFNYLGHVNHRVANPHSIGVGQSIALQNHRPEAISVNGIMYGDTLEFRLLYDGEHFTRPVMEAFAGYYRSRLASLIDHCMTQQIRRYTASDFGKVKLTAGELEEILGGSGLEAL